MVVINSIDAHCISASYWRWIQSPILPRRQPLSHCGQNFFLNNLFSMNVFFHYLNQGMNKRTCFQANKDPLFVCLFEWRPEQMWVWKGCLQVRKVSHHAPLKIIQSNQFNLLCRTNFYDYIQILFKHHEHYKRIHFELCSTEEAGLVWVNCLYRICTLCFEFMN